MKTINYIYKDRQDLKEFLKKNWINDGSNILVQVFSGELDKNVISQCLNSIKHFLPNSVIVWTTTDLEVLDWEVMTWVITVSFSIFDKTELRVSVIQDINKDFYKVWKNFANDLISADTKVLILFSDYPNKSWDEFLRWISDVKKDIIISWWFANDYKSKKVYIFSQNQIITKWIVWVAINDKDLVLNLQCALWWQNIWKKMMIDLREFRELEKEKKRLEEINKIKDDFMNVASHELRTPMTSIKGYLSMLLDEDFGILSDEVKSVLQIMYKSTLRQIELINDMLDVSKLESWKMQFTNQVFDLQDAVDDIYKEYKNIAKDKGFNFGKELIPWILVNVDPKALSQVIINLVSNAFKFTPRWWTVKLKTVLTSSKRFVKVEVIDTWIWIDEDDINKIFTKFWQIDNVLTRKEQWTWLGLSIAKEMVKWMWWILSVDSKLGKGSNFYFTIPVYNSENNPKS